jgi:glycosyltransferase involved in cell wall biosynthesis
VIVDRTELNKKLNIDHFFPPYFSILLPELGRPQYAIKCVDSIHNYADMPVEIVLHDDGSSRESQKILFDSLKDKVSTMIFNLGGNAGLAKAMNRCKDASSSEYLLEFNTDTYMTSSFLKNMKAALDLPYVGVVNVTPRIADGPGVYISPGGSKVALTRGSGTTLHIGIRRNVYEEAGNWDENVQTTASDTGFVGSVFGKGYFSVMVEGTIFNEMWLPSIDGKGNSGEPNPSYVSAARFTDHDNNPPIMFGLDKGTYDLLRHRRREDIWRGVNDANQREKMYPQWYNGIFFSDQLEKLYPRDKPIDWKFGEKYGHSKWKDQITRDFNL